MGVSILGDSKSMCIFNCFIITIPTNNFNHFNIPSLLLYINKRFENVFWKVKRKYQFYLGG